MAKNGMADQDLEIILADESWSMAKVQRDIEL